MNWMVPWLALTFTALSALIGVVLWLGKIANRLDGVVTTLAKVEEVTKSINALNTMLAVLSYRVDSLEKERYANHREEKK